MSTDNAKIIREIEKRCIASLTVVKRATRNPIIVAMVGLVGSGRSAVADVLAPRIGAALIRGDEIRLALRKRGQGYGAVRAIAERAALVVIARGGNVLIDSDFVDRTKRAALQKRAESVGARVAYLRTFCNPDVAIGRLATATYPPQSFFGGAHSVWRGVKRGVVVALREMWRRTPHHYQWSEGGGGRFSLKRLRIPCIAEIDTTGNWKKQLHGIVRRLKAL